MPTEASAGQADAARHATALASALRVGYVYPDGTAALAEVALSLERAKVIALIGANGSGKSTLLRILAGILAPTSGEVELLGVRQLARRPAGIDLTVRSRVSFIGQSLALDPDMTGQEMLNLLATLYGVGVRSRRVRVAEAAEAFGLTALLRKPIRTYSGGQSRRLHVAAGLLPDAELFLLDEPAAGLDVDGSELLWRALVRRARSGCTVTIATHDLHGVEMHADAVALLHAGRLVAIDAPAALVRRLHADKGSHAGTPALARVYRDLTGVAVDTAEREWEYGLEARGHRARDKERGGC